MNPFFKIQNLQFLFDKKTFSEKFLDLYFQIFRSLFNEIQIYLWLEKNSNLYLMKIQIYFVTSKIFRFVFSENIDLFFIFRKKEFWWLIANFEIKEELKHVKTLKNILSKHTNMADINYEQDIIKSNTYYQTSCNEQLNMSIKRKEK